MSIESFKQEANQESAETHLKLKMDIQRTLIEHACVPDEKWDDCALNWIKENSKDFAEIFNETLKSDPDLLRKWEENPSIILDIFHGCLDDMKNGQQKKLAA